MKQGLNSKKIVRFLPLFGGFSNPHIWDTKIDQAKAVEDHPHSILVSIFGGSYSDYHSVELVFWEDKRHQWDKVYIISYILTGKYIGKFETDKEYSIMALIYRES